MLTDRYTDRTTAQPVDFYQPGARSALGWSYNYFAIFCLSVCLSVRASKLMVAAVTYGCFDLAGLLASPLQKEAKRCQYFTTVDAQLMLHKHNITKADAEVREWQETGG